MTPYIENARAAINFSPDQRERTVSDDITRLTAKQKRAKGARNPSGAGAGCPDTAVEFPETGTFSIPESWAATIKKMPSSNVSTATLRMNEKGFIDGSGATLREQMRRERNLAVKSGTIVPSFPFV
jgi:hypothetical protein